MGWGDYATLLVFLTVATLGISYPAVFRIAQWWDLRRRRQRIEAGLDRFVAYVLDERARRSPADSEPLPDRRPLRAVPPRNTRLGSARHVVKGQRS